MRHTVGIHNNHREDKTMVIKNYNIADQHQCLALFDSNFPKYFAAHERPLFERFLAQEQAHFYCLAENHKVLACGGFRVDHFGLAYLAWGMVSQDQHRRGLGAQLLQYRLDVIKQQAPAWCVLLDTSQHSAPFFQRFGFKPYHTVPNGYTEGLDQVLMRYIWAA